MKFSNFSTEKFTKWWNLEKSIILSRSVSWVLQEISTSSSMRKIHLCSPIVAVMNFCSKASADDSFLITPINYTKISSFISSLFAGYVVHRYDLTSLLKNITVWYIHLFGIYRLKLQSFMISTWAQLSATNSPTSLL